MLDLLTIISANGLSEDLNICRNSEEYRNRGNIFGDENVAIESPVESSPVESGVVDAGVEMLNAFISRVLSSLPDLTSVDLSTEAMKGKGQ